MPALPTRAYDAAVSPTVSPPVPPPSPERQRLLRLLADHVGMPEGGRPLRLGIDGPDGSGKTTLAAELADELTRRGHVVVQASLDGFHRPSRERHARGADSPEGFWLDSYDHDRIVADLLVPAGPGGSGAIRTRIHDVATDRAVDQPPVTLQHGTVLLVDGLFLHRRELEEHWDLTVFLDVPFLETCRRMALRDGSDPNPDSAAMRRYVGGQRIYYRERTPWHRADLVVDNTDPAAPVVVADHAPVQLDVHR